MLSSILGVKTILLVGDTVPLPASYDIASAWQQIEVTMASGEGDGFQITFNLSRSGIVDYGLLQSGAIDPMKRIVIGVLFGAIPEVLIDGVVTHHQFNPGNNPGEATLTVSGRDLSILLDLEEKDDEFPNQPDFLIATRLIGNYAKYGLLPVPTPTTDFPIMLQRIPRQNGTDLATLRYLAERNGFVFYIEPLTFGVSQAYFGPENRLGIPQPALSVNLDAATNTKSFSATHDALATSTTRGSFLEQNSKQVIPIPALPPLKIPPLAAKPSKPNRIRLQRESANRAPATAATAALAENTRAPDAVTASGEVDSTHYGHALRPRRLVGVRGVGLSYDGFWYVRSVTHTLTRENYSQRFQLSREGTVSLTPAVIP